MILGLFRKNPRRVAIETLYERIAVAARRPFLFRDLGIPDTVEGRFEVLTLHVVLVLRRLRQLPTPADAIAQDLVDAFFRHLDGSLRELGVGDLGVPKRMKRLGEAFNGRSRAYDRDLDAAEDAALARTLARNVLGTDEPGHDLASYARNAEAELAGIGLDTILSEGPRFAGTVEPGKETPS
jgi:cytochrome b pre-mRNA-processing protein 3